MSFNPIKVVDKRRSALTEKTKLPENPRFELTEKEERTGSGLLSLEQAEPAVRIHSAPPKSHCEPIPVLASFRGSGPTAPSHLSKKNVRDEGMHAEVRHRLRTRSS
jgi:hypothetical protein